jgi:hypothetical protein
VAGSSTEAGRDDSSPSVQCTLWVRLPSITTYRGETEAELMRGVFVPRGPTKTNSRLMTIPTELATSVWVELDDVAAHVDAAFRNRRARTISNGPLLPLWATLIGWSMDS